METPLEIEKSRKETVRGRGAKRTTQTSQTTQSTCVLGIGSLPYSPPERAEKHSCASETVRETERKKNRTGESKNGTRKEKKAELSQKIQLPLNEKKTQR